MDTDYRVTGEKKEHGVQNVVSTCLVHIGLHVMYSRSYSWYALEGIRAPI